MRFSIHKKNKYYLIKDNHQYNSFKMNNLYDALKLCNLLNDYEDKIKIMGVVSNDK